MPTQHETLPRRRGGMKKMHDINLEVSLFLGTPACLFLGTGFCPARLFLLLSLVLPLVQSQLRFPTALPRWAALASSPTSVRAVF